MMCKNGILNKSICGVIIGVLASVSNAPAANVVQRDTVTSGSRVSTTRPTMAARRMPTMTTNVTTSETSTSTTPAETEKTETVVEEVVEESSVENKSSQFGSSLSSKSTSEHDAAAATLAELVRAQRAALDARDANAVAAAMATDLSGNGESTCDTVLRECMIQKCGANFGKCFADTDTTFFDKMDTCRRTTNCTGHEYQLFSVEIKADRDLNAKLATYNATIDCGNSYDDCIVSQCGTTYSKCIGKSAGDTAIAKCDSIAKSCIEYDSGLAMRAMAVFGELRQGAERQIAADELKLYDLREEMRSLCTRLGAMFDERSLDCVYTVNFRAGDESTLYASKKLYAGSTFDCTPNWFGIDVTTFRENAFRATREQSSASSALLGSGLGVATGALTSGAVGRAIDRHTADRALDKALAECMQYYTESECRAKIKTTKPAKTDDTKPTGNALQDLSSKLNQEVVKSVEDDLKAQSKADMDELQKQLDQEQKDFIDQINLSETDFKAQQLAIVNGNNTGTTVLNSNAITESINTGTKPADTAAETTEGKDKKILKDVKTKAGKQNVNFSSSQESTIAAFIRESLNEISDVDLYRVERPKGQEDHILIWLHYLDWKHESSEESYKKYAAKCASIGNKICPNGLANCAIDDIGYLDGQDENGQYHPGCEIQLKI